MAQTTLDQRMLGVGTSLTDHTITASDVVTFADVGDSNLTKRDTVQGILDLTSGTYDLHSQGSYSGATQGHVAFTSLTHDFYILHLWNVQISAAGPLMISISYDGSNYSDDVGAATALTDDWYSTNHCTRNNGDIATEGRHGTSAGETEITGYSTTYRPAAGAPQANLMGTMIIDRKKDGELYPGGMHDWSYHNAGYAPVRCNGAWFHTASGGTQGNVDAFKIYPESGHFTDLHFKLYGTNVV